MIAQIYLLVFLACIGAAIMGIRERREMQRDEERKRAEAQQPRGNITDWM
jgi:hypothetical protein